MAPRDDGKLRLILRAVGADAPEREHGARPAPLRFFHFFLFSCRKRLRREHARFGSVRAAGFGRRGAQTHAPAVATAAALTDSLVRADAGCGAPARAPPGSLATQTHPGSEAAAQTDVSRAAKAAPGRDEGAQTFGVG